MRTMAIVTLLAVAVAVGSCGKKSASPTAPSETGLPGTWQATRAEYEGAGMRLDVVPRGTTLVLVLNANSTYSLRVTDPGRPSDVADGSWSSSRDVLTLRQTGRTGETQFDYELSGGTLRLAGGHVLYDINADAVGDECILNMTLQRQ